jgi:hypothetical protein
MTGIGNMIMILILIVVVTMAIMVTVTATGMIVTQDGAIKIFAIEDLKTIVELAMVVMVIIVDTKTMAVISAGQ